MIKQIVVALMAAALVLAGGVGYTLTRDVTYYSTAQMVIVAGPDTPSSAIGNFDRSGIAGTLAEVMNSADTYREAGVPPVALKVEPLPESAILQVTSIGERDDVQPGLQALMQASARRASVLGDLWDLRVMADPSVPERIGTSPNLLIAATILLALLAALSVLAAPKLRTAVTVVSGRAVRVITPTVDATKAARRRR